MMKSVFMIVMLLGLHAGAQTMISPSQVRSGTNEFPAMGIHTNLSDVLRWLSPRIYESGAFDPAGSAAAVSNWASGRFSTLTGTVAYLADVTGLSNAVWEMLDDYVLRSDTNGWEVGSHAGFGDHAALDNLGWVQSGHTNAPFTFAYFGADNAAYGLTWLEVISDLGPYFDEEGSAAAVSNAAWSQGWITAGDIPAETDPIALLPDGSRPMTGNLNMGGFSVTNISTNSLTFANGTSLSSPSNGTLAVSGAEVYTTANPPPDTGSDYTFDPIYLRQTGASVTLADWLPNMVLANWFETRMRFSASSGGWESGLAYVFDDQSGILTNRSSGYAWRNPWYKNAYVSDPVPLYAWSMDDNAASTHIQDSQSTHNTNIAQRNSSDLHVDGKLNGAITNGSSDYLMSINNAGIEGASPRSLTAWAKIYAASDPGGIVGFGKTSYQSQQLCYLSCSVSSSGNFSFWGGEADIDSGVTSADGAWHFLAATYDGTTIRLYVDGIERGNIEAYLDTAAGKVFVGKDAVSGVSISGVIDDVRIYDVAISSNYVFELYNNGDGTTSLGGDVLSSMSLTATNTTIAYVASNALVTVLASSASALTTNDVYAYVVDLAGDTTNRASGWTLAATTDISNQMYTASITNLSLGTNLAAGVWASSNVSVTVKGIGAIYAP